MRENNTIITVRLADNEIDRDYERFSIAALQDMARMFVGKKGIIGEDKLGKTQKYDFLEIRRTGTYRQLLQAQREAPAPAQGDYKKL